MTPPPHTMQLAGRALTIATHDALRRDLERHGGRTEAPRDLGDAGRDLRRLRRLASDRPASTAWPPPQLALRIVG